MLFHKIPLCCLLILCFLCGCSQEPIAEETDESLEVASTTKFDSTLSIADCVSNDGTVEIPFVPYGTSLDSVESSLGLTDDELRKRVLSANESGDYSELLFSFDGVPAYISFLSVNSDGLYDEIAIDFYYDSINSDEVSLYKDKMLQSIAEIAPQKQIMQYTSTDGKTTIFCLVMPIEQIADKPVGLKRLTFFYNY
jgi:hypothetical protein